MLGATIPTLASPEFQASKTDDDIKTAITAGKGKMPAHEGCPGGFRGRCSRLRP